MIVSGKLSPEGLELQKVCNTLIMASLAARATHRLQALASHVVSFIFKSLRTSHGHYKKCFFGFYANYEGIIGIERGSGIAAINAQTKNVFCCVHVPSTTFTKML